MVSIWVMKRTQKPLCFVYTECFWEKLKDSPLFAVLPEPLAFLPQARQVQLGLQCHEEGAGVADLQIKPQAWHTHIIS